MSTRIFQNIEDLLHFAVNKGLLSSEDVCFARNTLFDMFRLNAPGEACWPLGQPDATATAILDRLFEDALALGIESDNSRTRHEMLDARIMGIVTPNPAQTRDAFARRYAEGADVALNWFYRMCKDSNYIRVDDIARSIRYMADTSVGQLEITINLTKPEKTLAEIAAAQNAPATDYPKCMLCKENPGYAGRANFPARQNHRMLPIKLQNEQWYFQYSPYAYYEEHCILLNARHIPMGITRDTFVRLCEAVDMFPSYLIGSNAELPIVGGSILSHDHFQGGRYIFPMDAARARYDIKSPSTGVSACVIDWPMSVVRLTSPGRTAIIDAAQQFASAWQSYTDEENDILAHTDAPHNTVTPIMRKICGTYRLDLVLRNNRTSDEHPLGIFHPHANLQHIKKENIGLIEVMGLFILPGRLKNSIEDMVKCLRGEISAEAPELTLHREWLIEIIQKNGGIRDESESTAREIIRAGIAEVCAGVLKDAGVFKNTEKGNAGMKKFVSSVWG